MLRLLEHCGTPQAVFTAPRGALSGLGLPQATLDYLAAPDWPAVERDLAWLAQPGAHLLRWDDPRYPALLREVSGAPPLLFVRGDPAWLARPQLAVVGTRNPTPAGREIARDFAAHLAAGGLVITSGLALGVDAIAHRGALDAGGGTVAVLGTGPDRVYPAANRALAHAIAGQGALVSEFPPGTPVQGENFPRRNRIISGLSLGVLVVEAATRSGSLITARLAADQGREVFAIPGSIHNPMARGCHALLRQGAKLVETAEDILEELGALAAVAGAVPPPPAGAETLPEPDGDYRQLLENLGHEPVSVDVLVERCGLTAEAVSSMLLILELQGVVVTTPGGLYSRTITKGS